MEHERFGKMTEHEAMTTLVKLLQGNAVRERFHRHYDEEAALSDDFETVCIGCGRVEDADYVCSSANGHVKEIKADAIRRGYTKDEADKIWMIVRGPHCWDCFVVAASPVSPRAWVN